MPDESCCSLWTNLPMTESLTECRSSSTAAKGAAVPGFVCAAKCFKAEQREKAINQKCPTCNLILLHVIHKWQYRRNEYCICTGTGLLESSETSQLLEGLRTRSFSVVMLMLFESEPRFCKSKSALSPVPNNMKQEIAQPYKNCGFWPQPIMIGLINEAQTSGSCPNNNHLGAPCLQIRLADISCSEFVQAHTSQFKLSFLLFMHSFLSKVFFPVACSSPNHNTHWLPQIFSGQILTAMELTAKCCWFYCN